jgi:ParB-like chromosome segregation protein Spo0J
MTKPKSKRPSKGKPANDVAPPGSDFVPIDSIHPWKDNPRKNAHAVEPLRASLKRFGWLRPIIVNAHPRCKGEIIIGHTARLAALAEGLEMVPVRFVSMPPARAHAAAIADNKLGEISTWDSDLLAELHKAGAISTEDFAVAGFSEDDLSKLGMPAELPSGDFSESSTERETRFECPKCHHKWRAKPAKKSMNAKGPKAA